LTELDIEEGEGLEKYQDVGEEEEEEGVESKRERTMKLNCLSIQEKENTRPIYGEITILGEAEYHQQSPKPSTSAGARSSAWGQARPMGATSHQAKSHANRG